MRKFRQSKYSFSHKNLKKKHQRRTLWSRIIVHGGRLALQRVIGLACTVSNKPTHLSNFHIFKKLPIKKAMKFEFY